MEPLTQRSLGACHTAILLASLFFLLSPLSTQPVQGPSQALGTNIRSLPLRKVLVNGQE